ncbi:MAG TPA: T9SS type A sorting domain-containing protein, partial [Saprospiraceae bacterium]|nr:T9SS type A sorting domain-containing protein [Saprospiraceae bacterium]
SSGNPLVTQRPIDDVTEADEGSYLYMHGVSVDSIVATGVSGYNVYIRNAADHQVLVRADADLGIDSTTLASFFGVELAGIGTQFDPTFPYTGGYQFLLTNWSPGGGFPILDQHQITVNPNPASDMLHFESELLINRLELFGLDGRLILSKNLNSESGDVTVDHLSEGLYIAKATTPKGIWTTKVIVRK